jgi:hypothetical protein
VIGEVGSLEERFFSALRAGQCLTAFWKSWLCGEEIVGQGIFDFRVYERPGTVRTAENPTCHGRTPDDRLRRAEARRNPGSPVFFKAAKDLNMPQFVLGARLDKLHGRRPPQMTATGAF